MLFVGGRREFRSSCLEVGFHDWEILLAVPGYAASRAVFIVICISRLGSVSIYCLLYRIVDFGGPVTMCRESSKLRQSPFRSVNLAARRALAASE